MSFRPEKHDDLLGKYWRDDAGIKYKLVGIMYDFEDWWWILARGRRFSKHTQMLSCVCNIEAYGFERIED